MLEITAEKLSLDEVTSRIKKESHGAVVTFTGTVRSPSHGKEVNYLEYEVYPEMAYRQLEQITAEITGKWQLGDIAICHRTGRIRPGETVVVIAVAGPHREQAFQACQYAIDRLKEIVPIWKKEVYKDGESWVDNHG